MNNASFVKSHIYMYKYTSRFVRKEWGIPRTDQNSRLPPRLYGHTHVYFKISLSLHALALSCKALVSSGSGTVIQRP
jgi:hypothetical protein